MTDHNDLEARLRHDLHHRASSIDAHAPAGGSLTIAESARRQHAARSRRRAATASALTVVAVTAGLLVVARDPAQEVRTDRDRAASQSLAAGSATGSSTGSATGSPQGWAHDYEATAAALPFDPLALRLDPSFRLTADSTHVSQQATGQRAADLAVAADVRIGQPLRFLVASVQDADRLTSGTGGTATTIAGRPARIISKRAAVTITWDLSETERVLVIASGVDETTLAAWLGSLALGADGQWAFGPVAATGGLVAVPTVTVDGQAGRYLNWNKTEVAADGTCTQAGYSVDLTSGGAYELWGTIAESSRWSDAAASVVEVSLPGRTETSVAFASPWNDALVLDGDTVIRLSSWTSTQESGESVIPSFDLLYRPTDAEAALAYQVQEEVFPPECDKEGRAPVATAPATIAPATTGA